MESKRYRVDPKPELNQMVLERINWDTTTTEYCKIFLILAKLLGFFFNVS